MAETILVVDDDPVQRRLVEEALKRIGHRPVVVDGGEAGLAFLSSREGQDVALVVLDLVMPDLDGMGVLARMREAGIDIARRTVAKYREAMRIPSSVQRRREKQAALSAG